MSGSFRRLIRNLRKKKEANAESQRAEIRDVEITATVYVIGGVFDRRTFPIVYKSDGQWSVMGMPFYVESYRLVTWAGMCGPLYLLLDESVDANSVLRHLLGDYCKS